MAAECFVGAVGQWFSQQGHPALKLTDDIQATVALFRLHPVQADNKRRQLLQVMPDFGGLASPE